MSEQRGSPLSGAAEQAAPTVDAKGPKTAAFALEDLKRLLRLPVSFLDRLRTLIIGFKQATTLQADAAPATCFPMSCSGLSHAVAVPPTEAMHIRASLADCCARCSRRLGCCAARRTYCCVRQDFDGSALHRDEVRSGTAALQALIFVRL